MGELVVIHEIYISHLLKVVLHSLQISLFALTEKLQNCSFLSGNIAGHILFMFKRTHI